MISLQKKQWLNAVFTIRPFGPLTDQIRFRKKQSSTYPDRIVSKQTVGSLNARKSKSETYRCMENKSYKSTIVFFATNMIK